MGFSFSRIEEELRSERFGRYYEELRLECPYLAPFPDPASLLSFFHERNRDYPTKDLVLAFLVDACRRGGHDGLMAVLLLALFNPAIKAIYKLNRKRWRSLDGRDFVQDICAFLLEIILETKIAPRKVAAQIAGRLKNRTRGLINQKLRKERFEIMGGMENLPDNPPPSGNDDPAWAPSRSSWLSEEISNVVNRREGIFAGGWDDDGFRITDAEAFLDGLLREGVISEDDRAMLTATILEGRSFKAMIPQPENYQRDRQRRRRVILDIRAHILKVMK
ncbi:MAG: hypothetical protein CO013_06715 [Syntrophobacterales bacterium CG_4_8_14_3_um_filter_58_8]|nr:MAG: hypothetical protein COS57_03255 [Syntrophobacterales bacterium CG03_land_8_20_14_0_80_58_14]PJC73512.1 MAG: hypothetical protein CO013_06715 [Syntrophobacterales bacterium CG_4_8_14_3_um_filter_58_8]